MNLQLLSFEHTDFRLRRHNSREFKTAGFKEGSEFFFRSLLYPLKLPPLYCLLLRPCSAIIPSPIG